MADASRRAFDRARRLTEAAAPAPTPADAVRALEALREGSASISETIARVLIDAAVKTASRP